MASGRWFRGRYNRPCNVQLWNNQDICVSSRPLSEVDLCLEAWGLISCLIFFPIESSCIRSHESYNCLILFWNLQSSWPQYVSLWVPLGNYTAAAIHLRKINQRYRSILEIYILFPKRTTPQLTKTLVPKPYLLISCAGS